MNIAGGQLNIGNQIQFRTIRGIRADCKRNTKVLVERIAFFKIGGTYAHPKNGLGEFKIYLSIAGKCKLRIPDFAARTCACKHDIAVLVRSFEFVPIAINKRKPV